MPPLRLDTLRSRGFVDFILCSVDIRIFLLDWNVSDTATYSGVRRGHLVQDGN
jgi:hypothetical protein